MEINLEKPEILSEEVEKRNQEVEKARRDAEKECIGSSKERGEGNENENESSRAMRLFSQAVDTMKKYQQGGFDVGEIDPEELEKVADDLEESLRIMEKLKEQKEQKE